MPCPGWSNGYWAVNLAGSEPRFLSDAHCSRIERGGNSVHADWLVGGSILRLATTGSQFNVIDPSSGWKADLIFRKARQFSETEFRRRQQMEILGIEVALTTLEDLIIAKVEWSEMGDSELQRRDVRELLEIAGHSLDQNYLDRWIDALGLRQAWERVTRSK